MLRRLQRSAARPSEGGFTLIELLVVIIILGILAAVVVFAVGGVGDKGKASAITIDARTIRTAEEAYCAQNGRYADGAALLAGGFLSELPQYHQIFARQGNGPCNGWQYSVLKTGQAGRYPEGSWANTNAPPTDMYPVFGARLADGRVLVGGASNIDDSPATAIWDPVSTNWTPVDPHPEFLRFNVTGSTLLLRDDPSTAVNECASGAVNNCGKVLVREKFLFDPAKAGAGLGEPQWETLTFDESTCSICAFGGFTFGLHPRNMIQLKGDPSTCGTLCGKVLMSGKTTAGGPDNVLIYDPKDNSYTNLSYNYDSDRISSHHLVSQLPDGKLLFCCYQSTSDVFDPLTLTWSPGQTPSGWYWRQTGGGFTGGEPEPTPVLPNGNLLFVRDTTVGPGATVGIYTPQPGGLGSWRSVPGCSTTDYCKLLGSLPDGRVLARDGLSNTTYAYNLATDSWEPAGEMNGSPDPSSMVALTLDPDDGPCGAACGKLFLAALNSAELFTP